MCENTNQNTCLVRKKKQNLSEAKKRKKDKKAPKRIGSRISHLASSSLCQLATEVMKDHAFGLTEIVSGKSFSDMFLPEHHSGICMFGPPS